MSVANLERKKEKQHKLKVGVVSFFFFLGGGVLAISVNCWFIWHYYMTGRKSLKVLADHTTRGNYWYGSSWELVQKQNFLVTRWMNWQLLHQVWDVIARRPDFSVGSGQQIAAFTLASWFNFTLAECMLFPNEDRN